MFKYAHILTYTLYLYMYIPTKQTEKHKTARNNKLCPIEEKLSLEAIPVVFEEPTKRLKTKTKAGLEMSHDQQVFGGTTDRVPASGLQSQEESSDWTA